VGAAAFEGDVDAGGGRTCGVVGVGDLADGDVAGDVEGEDGVGFGILEGPFFDHESRAVIGDTGDAFFGGLEDEFDGAWDFAFELVECFCDAEANGGVGVVTAGVFDAFDGGFVRGVEAGFVDRESVHVRSPCDYGAGFGTFKQSCDAVAGDVRFDIFEAQGTEFFDDELAGADFVVR